MSTIQFYPLEKAKPNGVLVADAISNYTKQSLQDYIQANHKEIEQKLYLHGAIVFRNFQIESPQDFEDIALSIDADLKNNYLGTSPRNSKTKYTFSASELPHFYPIPQHCEMSFLHFPPRKLFFYCHVAPAIHGETPVCDFRKVASQLTPEVKNAFLQKGVKTIRNYKNPEAKIGFDLWQLKKWNEMFHTTEKQQVEDSCKQNKIDFEWLDDNGLRLSNQQAAFKVHPITQEEVWFNHLQVFHRDAAAIEYAYIAERHKNISATAFSWLTAVLTSLKQFTTSPENLATHCTFADGTEIPSEYVKHVQDVIWQNMQFPKWQQGDIMAIDNYSTSHGRMPYKGAREIYVCWSAE